MNAEINGEKYTTLSDYMNDESKVSTAEKAEIEFAAELIGKLIEAREKKGLTQRDLAEISGGKVAVYRQTGKHEVNAPDRYIVQAS